MLQPRERPRELPSVTYRFKMACGRSIFITVSLNSGEMNYPFEVFVTMGKAGGCHRAIVEALGRAISMYLRLGGDAESIVRTLRHISCPFRTPNPANPKSCPDAIAMVLEEVMSNGKMQNRLEQSEGASCKGTE